MRLKLKRYTSDKNTTLGFLSIEEEPFCHTLEDAFRAVKVKHKTRIPAGCYRIQFREALTGMTHTYRNRFAWFKWHLELIAVPNFDSIYIHIGNDEDDTSGCILVGGTATSPAFHGRQDMTIRNSTLAFERLYIRVAEVLNMGGQVTVSIEDHDK